MEGTIPDKEKSELYRVFYVFGDFSCLKILFELERYGEKTFSQLRDELKINPTTLSKKLKVLTAVELIVPDRTHDSLRVYYSLYNNTKPLKRILDALERVSGKI